MRNLLVLLFALSCCHAVSADSQNTLPEQPATNAVGGHSEADREGLVERMKRGEGQESSASTQTGARGSNQAELKTALNNQLNELEISVKLFTSEAKLRLSVINPESYKQANREENVEPSAQMAAIYKEAATDSSKTRGVLSYALGNYYSLKEGARGAAQVSQAADEANVRLTALVVAQNQRIIEQNDQIIALLQQIAKNKP